MKEPELGDVVCYRLSAADADLINSRRLHTGIQGNFAGEGEDFPALIVRDWGASYNLQVFLDGADTYWATSRLLKEEPEDGCLQYAPVEPDLEPKAFLVTTEGNEFVIDGVSRVAIVDCSLCLLDAESRVLYLGERGYWLGCSRFDALVDIEEEVALPVPKKPGRKAA
jgi:hypothetical protein